VDRKRFVQTTLLDYFGRELGESIEGKERSELTAVSHERLEEHEEIVGDEDLLRIQSSDASLTAVGYACSKCIHFNIEFVECEIYTNLPTEAFKAPWFPKTCPNFSPKRGGEEGG